MGWYSFAPYVSVAERRANAAKEMAKLAKKGRTVSPVRIDGRTIACTFWGKAWCTHLESYSDYSNRLPRGRTYVRNGSVVDLHITPGLITAIVSGSSLYDVEIKIDPLASKRWEAIRRQCAGQIGSMIELLQGRLSEQVMRIITDREQGLFPAPMEIKKSCSCPDWADMCKHVAAVLYGVGNRFDHQPELLFTLRKADHLELIAQATDVNAITRGSTRRKTVATGDLADVFGIELDTGKSDAGESASVGLPTPVVVNSPPPPEGAAMPERKAKVRGAAKQSQSEKPSAARSVRHQKKRAPAVSVKAMGKSREGM